MNRTLRLVALALAATSFGIACAKVPYTQRRQFNVVPDVLMNQLGKQAYVDALEGQPVERKTEDAETLKKVGNRIAKVANEPDYEWTYKLIEDDTINAWCLPGGYIGVYTGILPVFKHEAGMAFVLGHEVGHAKAQHSAERLSQQLALLGGLAGLNLYLENKSKLNKQQREMLLAALGLGAEVGVLLPFSRTQESEADVIGMMYMAKAGYPPAESIDIWDRMEKASGGSNVPEFLSTHPSHENRKKNLRDWMSQAKKRYERNKLDRDTTQTLWTSSGSSGSSGSGGVKNTGGSGGQKDRPQ